MEVHHHPIDIGSHTARKKWTHYFWEFLMLFLAVFCGFLAENQREHFVEAHRAEEYAKGLYDDIKNDTADIHRGLRYIRFFVNFIDSTHSIASRNKEKTKFPASFYYYSRLTTNTYQIDWSRSTLNQLVQSGNLRYFRNKELVEKINRYYAIQGEIEGSNETDKAHRDLIRTLRNKILENKYFTLFLRYVPPDDVVEGKPVDPRIDSLIKLSLPLQLHSEQFLDEYLNHLEERAFRLSSQIRNEFIIANDLAEQILKMLKKEYHLN